MRQHGKCQDGLNKSCIYEVVDEMVGWPEGSAIEDVEFVLAGLMMLLVWVQK
jgi:hypothetical protein